MIETAELELQWLLSLETRSPDWMRSYIRNVYRRLRWQLIRERRHRALQEKILDDQLFVQQSDFETVVIQPKEAICD